MAWKRVRVRTKPNSDTVYEKMSDEVIDYMKTNYDDQLFVLRLLEEML